MKTFTIAIVSSIITLTTALSPPYEPTCETCVYTPNENKCDITTSCTYVWGHQDPHTPGPYYCACRHGYRATGYEANDMEVQWRLPWYGTPSGDPSQEGRVFVKPGVECNTLCDDWYLGKDGCKAVQEKEWCM
ncbi:uncharacterized protein ALTATR162_LOCUS9484 [Alternaria atra]|uniref:Uncharacterized protein n=1 Tax=Alternaria atra TaxID=119953 RepID=A0A8J2I713_9PLEO|nr:uncharacterized protein ALTATR162_LOCUS9484 [Alternaria atra]CAG5180881.1 unnamed protein product [Alternaria atra]